MFYRPYIVCCWIITIKDVECLNYQVIVESLSKPTDLKVVKIPFCEKYL